jgi:MFS family permease
VRRSGRRIWSFAAPPRRRLTALGCDGGHQWFGRLGGVGGPLLGGFLVAAGLALNSIFYVLAAVALIGTVLTLLVPSRRTRDRYSTPIEPTAVATPVATLTAGTTATV